MSRNDAPRVVAVIPSRYGSTRFPGKSLAMIKDKPMVQWVYERTKQSNLISRVIVATDDRRIFDAVRNFGGEAVMTAATHQTGTDRIAEVAGKEPCELVVNVQGDEPLIRHEMIDEAIRPLLDDAAIPMGTLCSPITDRTEAVDPNVVKVVRDNRGFALYFSRAPIPWSRDAWAGRDGLSALPFSPGQFKHIGLYVYRRDFLLRYTQLPQTPLEDREKLEQLRALEHGFRIRVVETAHESFGVDIPGDLGKILQRL